MVRVLLTLVASMLALTGCEDRRAPAAGGPVPQARAESSDALLDPDLVAAIGLASYRTSPPAHPELTWPQLAPMIEAARGQLERAGPLGEPESQKDVLAERVGSAQLAALARARSRAIVYRADAARLLARGDADAAAGELRHVLDIARELATWGVPTAAETSANMIENVLAALSQPEAAPITMALTGETRARLAAALDALDAADPAGRMRAMVESHAARNQALRSRARGTDGPTAVRLVASRYATHAVRAEPEIIERRIEEANAFARALADGWSKPSRSAITQRLRDRQTEDATGVLTLLLSDAADACDADAVLRGRIKAAADALR